MALNGRLHIRHGQHEASFPYLGAKHVGETKRLCRWRNPCLGQREHELSLSEPVLFFLVLAIAQKRSEEWLCVCSVHLLLLVPVNMFSAMLPLAHSVQQPAESGEANFLCCSTSVLDAVACWECLDDSMWRYLDGPGTERSALRLYH